MIPFVETAKKLSKMRLDPMIMASQVLSERIAPACARDRDNTMFSKKFDGGALMLTGAKQCCWFALYAYSLSDFG